MSSDSNESLNVILGQIEDELSLVRSARDQVDSVLDANEALKELVRQCGDQSKSSAEALAAQASRLAECSDAIERASTEGVEAIKKQTSDAKKAISASSAAAAEKLSSESVRLAELARTMERTSAETGEVVIKQASDAQKALRDAADKAVEEVSSGISESTEQAVDSLNDGIGKAKQGVDSAIESLGKASAGLEQSRKALVEAHQTASEDCRHQSEETTELLEAVNRQLVEFGAMISTIADIDIEGLSNDIRSLKEEQKNSMAALQQQLRSMVIMMGACVVACLAILAKLFLW